VCEVLRAFVDLLETGVAPPVSLVDGARAVHIAEACMRSAAQSRPVDVAPRSGA
jgi:predicted dehydrogenase